MLVQAAWFVIFFRCAVGFGSWPGDMQWTGSLVDERAAEPKRSEPTLGTRYASRAEPNGAADS